MSVEKFVRLSMVVCCAIFIIIMAPVCSFADAVSGDKPAVLPRFEIETAVMDLSGTFDGEKIDYKVVAGLTPLFGDDGEETGRIFSTSYLAAPKEGENRPVAFIFNGGPGSASIYLHVGAFGPKTVSGTGNEGLDAPAPPYSLVDNPGSPLGVADLVFVDPIGTGFSRSVTKKSSDNEAEDSENTVTSLSPNDPDANGRFWGVEDDLESLAEFVRVWLSENKRWGAEIFLIGESYGGFRAAGLPYYLSAAGIATSGTAMVSPVISYKDLIQTAGEFTADVEILPTAAAIAHYHGLLAPEFQVLSAKELTDRAWKWARTEYQSALFEGNQLSRERFDAVVGELSRLTSIPAIEFSSRNLRFPMNSFSSLILREKELVISPYDGRLTAPAAFFNDYWGEDPLNLITNEAYNTAFMNFLYRTVGISTLRHYKTLNDSVWPNWKFFLKHDRGESGFADNGALLAIQMRRFPSLKVFVAMGRYDTITPPESAMAALTRLEVPAGRMAGNLETHIYNGGHMMYINPVAAGQLRDDIKNWIKSALHK
jgi:carboxypeptidase C (cathepsin A)